MCGIAGVYDPTARPGTVGILGRMMFPRLVLRGRDALGFTVCYEDGTTFTFKAPITHPLRGNPVADHAMFTQTWEVATNGRRILWAVANARAVPEPEWLEHPDGPEEEDCQPAATSRFACVFNGCIANDKELVEKHGLEVPSTVDTFVIPALMEKKVVEGKGIAEAVQETFRELEGSFACLIGVNPDGTAPAEMWAVSNFAPLSWAASPTGLKVFASMPEWIPGSSELAVHDVAPYKALHFCRDIQINHSLLPPSPMEKERVLVVCSSGLDSLTTARLYQCLGYDISLLHFDYGCAATPKEVESLHRAAKAMDVPAQVVDFKAAFEGFKDSRLLRGDSSLKDDVTWLRDAESTASYVPARNAMFALAAASIAEKEGFRVVAQGLNLVDSVYPDNQVTFLRKLNDLLAYALNWNANVHFRSPMVHLVKMEILHLALYLGAPLLSSWSCYRGEELRCGNCGPCRYRQLAFHQLGYADPAPYKFRAPYFSKREISKAQLTRMLNPASFQADPTQHPMWEYIKDEI